MAYNVISQTHLISAGSMAASITSPALNIENQDNVAFQAIFTGTPTGTFAVQVSVDHQQENNGAGPVVTNAGTWFTLTPTLAAATGGAGNGYVDISNISAPYIRVVYTRASGSGSLDLWVAAKGI